MKVRILGSGTSCGVPSIGCYCDVCRSSDPHDRRLRSSALVEEGDTRILIDCGPDFRQQILPLPFAKIDAVLLTHIHYDHVGGLDDLRPFSRFGTIQIYANGNTCRALKTTMPYCFQEHLYPGVPHIALTEVLPHVTLSVGCLKVIPIEVIHGKMPILGYRIGRFAYITDMKTINDKEYEYLDGVETLVVNALRFEKEHHSHQLVPDAIEFSRRVGAEKTFFIHMNHDVGLHVEACGRLPEGFAFAYDGQIIDV